MHPTGPRTAEGKLRSRYNALKHGLTGRTLSIHDDEREPYQAHVQSYIDLYQPVGHAEQVLVRNLADDYWRSLRGRTLEHRHMNQALAGHPEDLKVLLNLSLYLNRIERSIRNNLQALDTMQRQRRDAGRAEAAPAPTETTASEFVFSNSQVAQASACGSDRAQASASESAASLRAPASATLTEARL